MSTLTVTGRGDVAGVASDLDGVAAKVRGLGDDVARVDDVARTSGGGLDALADSSDNMASRSSQAAGGLGDLAGGLEAIGATGAGTALEGVALAAQTAVGAGDILNLVAETTAGKYILQTAATVGSTAATAAQTVATTAATAATTAFNAVMALNPVALVVIAVIALVVGLKLAYDHIGPVKDAIDAAGRIGKEAIDKVSDAVDAVIDWFARLPASARDAWDAVKDAVSGRIEDAIGKVDDLVDAVVSGPRDVASTVAGFFSSMFDPILDAIGWVQDLIDKISNIDFPDIPGIPGLRTDTGISKEDFLDPFNPNGINAGNLLAANLTLSVKKQDEDEATRLLIESLRDYFARQGMTLSLTEET